MNDVRMNIPDVMVAGDPGIWITVCKAWSEHEGWMKSTKVMQVADKGCLMQVSTQQGEHVAEALVWLPGITPHDILS